MADLPAEFTGGLQQLRHLVDKIETFKWTDAYTQIALVGDPWAYALLFRDGRIVIGSMEQAKKSSSSE